MSNELNVDEIDWMGGKRSENLPYARSYHQKGREWPRCAVMVNFEVRSLAPTGGVKVSCAVQEVPDGWWEECGVPKSLLKDAIELLTEAMEDCR